MVAALKKGEIDFADSLERDVVQLAEERQGHHHRPGRVLRLRRARVQHRRGDRRRHPDRRRQPAPQGQAGPAGDQLRDRQQDPGRQGPRRLRRAPAPRSSRRSTPTPHYDPADKTRNYDPDKANQMLDDAGYTKGSDGIRVDPASGKKLSFRLFGRDDSPTSKDSVQYIAGWLKDIGIEAKIQIVSEDKLTEIIGERRVRHVRVGLGGRARPGLPAVDVHCAPRAAPRTAARSAPACPTASTATRPTTRCTQQQSTRPTANARAEIVKQMQQMLYDDAPYVVTYYYDNLEAYRTDRFTDFKPQPDPKGSLLFQYGTYSYRNITPGHAGRRPRRPAAPACRVGLAAGALVVLGLGGFLVDPLAAYGRRPGVASRGTDQPCRDAAVGPVRRRLRPAASGGRHHGPVRGHARSWPRWPACCSSRSSTSSCSGCCPATRPRSSPATTRCRPSASPQLRHEFGLDEPLWRAVHHLPGEPVRTATWASRSSSASR